MSRFHLLFVEFPQKSPSFCSNITPIKRNLFLFKSSTHSVNNCSILFYVKISSVKYIWCANFCSFFYVHGTVHPYNIVLVSNQRDAVFVLLGLLLLYMFRARFASIFRSNTQNCNGSHQCVSMRVGWSSPIYSGICKRNNNLVKDVCVMGCCVIVKRS